MMDLACRGIPRNSLPRPFRTRVVYAYAGYVTVRQDDGRCRSIPVFRRRRVQITAIRGVR
jgi:hypothetical protein